MATQPIDQGKIRLRIPIPNSWSYGFWKESESTIAGQKWKLSVSTEKSESTKDVRYLGAYIYCNWEFKTPLNWSCAYQRTFRLIAQDGSGRELTEDERTVYQSSWPLRYTRQIDASSNTKGWGCPEVISWKDLVDPANPWLRNDSIEVEVGIAVLKVEGLLHPELNPFPTCSEAIDDVTLVVENQRFAASKQYLSKVSPVFSAMFSGSFAESIAEEVPIGGVSPDEFADFLRVIGPSRAPIDDMIVESLLKLADYYDMKPLLCACEQFLLKSTFTIDKKLLIAEKYKLVQLHDACFKATTTAKQLKDLLDCCYDRLPEETLLALLRKSVV